MTSGYCSPQGLFFLRWSSRADTAKTSSPFSPTVVPFVFQLLNSSSNERQRQGRLSPISISSFSSNSSSSSLSPDYRSRFFSPLSIPQLESEDGNGNGSCGNGNGNWNWNWNPFNNFGGEGGWWCQSGGPCSISQLVFIALFSFFCSRLYNAMPSTFSKNAVTIEDDRDSLIALFSVLGCLIFASSSASALEETSARASAAAVLWEVRGDRWTKVVCRDSDDLFLPDDRGAIAAIRLLLSSPQHCTRLFLGLLLPEGYPQSVSSDYLEYSLWRGVQGVASQISGVLATQGMIVSLMMMI